MTTRPAPGAPHKDVAQEFCLIATPVAGGRWRSLKPGEASANANAVAEPAIAVAETAETYEAFAVPPGVSHLTSRADGRPRFGRDVPGDGGDPSLGDGLVLEPLNLGTECLLVMACSTSQRPRLNGLPAPRVRVLQVGDQVQLHRDSVWHVTLFRQPQIGRAGEERVGAECLLCRTPLEDDAVVYTCPHCAGALHHENDSTKSAARAKPLACAEMCKTCPSCQKQVVLKSGYEFIPNST